MGSHKIALLVCRSCIRENTQADPSLTSEEHLRKIYSQKLKKRLFGKLAELRIVDCLTNCQNPNSVQIDREDGEMLFGRINNCARIDDVIQLVEKLRGKDVPFQPSESLKPCLVFVRPHRDWRSEGEAVPADRIRL